MAGGIRLICCLDLLLELAGAQTEALDLEAVSGMRCVRGPRILKIAAAHGRFVAPSDVSLLLVRSARGFGGYLEAVALVEPNGGVV